MAATTNIHGFNVGGNNNSFEQRGHFYRGVFSGNVTGMLVKQNATPNMTVLVEHGSALLNKNTISASVAEIKADTSVTVDTANTANPRIDTVVIYEDTSVAIPTVEANYWQDGAGGRFKIVSLPGTAAASPSALSDASIQSSIGAGKPFARLADITVPANSTTILNSNIADKRSKIAPAMSNYGTAGLLSADSNGNVSAKVPFSVECLSGSSSRTGQTGTSWLYLAGGYSYTNSTSSIQTVMLSGSIMIHMTDSSIPCTAALFAGTTKVSNDIYHTGGTSWSRYGLDGYYKVPANTTVTFQWGIRTNDTGGKFMEAANGSSDSGTFAPTIRGIVI